MSSEKFTEESDTFRKHVMRKVSVRLIPFLAIAYFFNYLDKANIAMAKLTMGEDLGLTETAFGIASGVFFIGYALFEVPSNLAQHRFGARRWIARIMVTWGIAATAMTWVNNETTLYILRLLVGVFEAGFFPGVMLYLTSWLPRATRIRLSSLFLLSLPVSAAIGSPVNGAIIQYMDGLFGLDGWRVMFLVNGIPTVLLGIAAWFILVDRPRDAKWLTPDEREWLDATISAEHAQVAQTGRHSFRQSLTDVRVWTLGFVYFGLGYGVFALGFFLPTIIAGFRQTFETDMSVFETGLLAAIPNAAGAVALYYWSRYCNSQQGRVWHVALPMTIAACSVPVALYMQSSVAALIVLCITSMGIFSTFPVFWTLPTKFLTGTAAASGLATINTVGALAGFAAPYVTGALLDVTGSAKAGLWVVGTVMLAAVAVLTIRRNSFVADSLRAVSPASSPAAEANRA